jgi:hypothetical protein
VQWGGPAVTFPLDFHQMQSMLEAGLGDPPARLCWMAADSDRPVGQTSLHPIVRQLAVAIGGAVRDLPAKLLQYAYKRQLWNCLWLGGRRAK